MLGKFSKSTFTYFLCWCLAYMNVGTTFAQTDTIDTTSQSESNRNENEAKAKEYANKSENGHYNTTQCFNPKTSEQDRNTAERNYHNNLLSQGFDKVDGEFSKIEQIRAQLDAKSGTLTKATSGVASASGSSGSQGNIDEVEQIKKDIVLKEKEISTQKTVVTNKERSLRDVKSDCYSRNSGYCSREQREIIKIKEAELFQAQTKLSSLEVTLRKLKASVYKVTVVDGANKAKGADAQMNQAHGIASSVESSYNALLSEIQIQENKAKQAYALAERRMKEVELQVNNANDYELFEAAIGSYYNKEWLEENFGSEQARVSQRRVLSDLEALSLSSAAINQLNCVDFSDVKSTSYPLFRAAAATYVASQLNNKDDYGKDINNCVLSCVSIDDLKQDQKAGSERYPQFKNKNFEMETTVTNCKTESGIDGLFVNDVNADDDKDEQYKSVERAANMHAKLYEFSNLRKDLNSGALEMFKSAHAAALMEWTSKMSRVGAAHGQLEKAKAWKKKAQNNIRIYIAILAIYWAINGTPGCNGCKSYAIGVATALLIWHKADLVKADKDIRKWKRKLAESRIHTHMMCNYPGSDATIEDLGRAKDIPLTYPKHVIDSRVTAMNDTFIEENNYVAKMGNWIRELQGKKTSLPYDVHLPGKNQFQKYLKGLGFAATKSKDIAASLTNMIFPNLEASGLSSSFGMHNQADSFKQFLRMKVGAWKLQSYNAHKDVNLRELQVETSKLHPVLRDGKTLYDYIQYNNDSFQGKTIQKTGFPLPETRHTYIMTVIMALQSNMVEMQGYITELKAHNQKWSSLLNKMRQNMGFAKGLTDNLEEKKIISNGCLSKDDSGDFVADANCACKATNTCANLETPTTVSSFNAPSFSANASLSINTGNSILNGNIKGARANISKLSDSNNAISDTARKKLNKVYKLENKETNTSNGDHSEGYLSRYIQGAALVVSKDSRKNAISNYNNRNSNLNNSESKLSNSSDVIKNTKTDSIDSKNTGSTASSVSLKGQKASKFKSPDLGLNDLDFGDEEVVVDVDSESEGKAIKNSHERMITKSKSSNQDNNKELKGIYNNRKINIFSQLSRRYKETAYPVLLKKKSDQQRSNETK